jgi:hypothetical protein
MRIDGTTDRRAPMTPYDAAYAEILANMRRVVTQEGFNRWVETPLPRLGDRTPVAAMLDGDIERVRDLTRSYLETSFT